jgi:hypothetical protein
LARGRHWLKKAEWYELNYVIIFDSWDMLIDQLLETDLHDLREKMREEQEQRAYDASRAWDEALHAMQEAWRTNPARALRFDDYDTALRELYGLEAIGAHDAASYVVARANREVDMAVLRAYDAHRRSASTLASISVQMLVTNSSTANFAAEALVGVHKSQVMRGRYLCLFVFDATGFDSTRVEPVKRCSAMQLLFPSVDGPADEIVTFRALFSRHHLPVNPHRRLRLLRLRWEIISDVGSDPGETSDFRPGGSYVRVSQSLQMYFTVS